jgi:hypothetical protein
VEFFFFAFAYIFVGLTGIGLILISRFHILMFYYSLFSVMIGIWTLSVSPNRHIIYAGSWRNIELASFCLMPLGLALYFDRLFWGGWRNIFRRIWQYYLLLIAFSLVYTLAWTRTLETVLPLFQISLIAAIMLWMGCILPNLRRHKENLTIILGASIMGITGITDILHALRILRGESNLVHFGIFAFFIALSGHLILAIFEAAERVGLLTSIGRTTSRNSDNFFRSFWRKMAARFAAIRKQDPG